MQNLTDLASIKEVVELLNEMIVARAHLLAAYGPQLEMVYINGHVHDCSQPVTSNIYFRGKIEIDRAQNIIPLRGPR